MGARWQKICTGFHRTNPVSCARCIESDTLLANEMKEGSRFSIYQCKNGLTDAASPIIIEGEHIANMFAGQFLTAPPDEDFFRRQAAAYGFAEGPYLQALAKVPVLEKEQLVTILDFLTTISEMLATMGLDRLRQKESRKGAGRPRPAAAVPQTISCGAETRNSMSSPTSRATICKNPCAR